MTCTFRTWFVGLLGLAAASLAAAQESVDNRSSVMPGGLRMLEQRIVVPAPPPAVWDAWSTTDGFRSWAAPIARVDFRRGGSIEATYDFGAKLGDPNNIRNEIVALVPGRMFAVRNVQAPAKLPFDAATFQSLHTVVLLEPRGMESTLVTIVMPDVGSGPAFDGVYRHFEWANAYTLEQLRRRFVEGPRDWAKVEVEMKAKAAR